MLKLSMKHWTCSRNQNRKNKINMFFMLSVSPTIISFLCFSFLTTICITQTRATPTFLFHSCPNDTVFSPNTTYQTNLNNLLSWLSSNSTPETGFYNLTSTSNNAGDTAYGLFLCRGDVTAATCRDCVSAAASQVIKMCPQQKQSMIWYDECFLRYSNMPFFSEEEVSPMVLLTNTANMSDPIQFMQFLAETMNGLVRQAATGRDGKKFATKETNFSSFQEVYTLAQCTPDISEAECERCLKHAVASLPNCCDGKRGGRVMVPSCNVRYELYPFYQVAPVSSSPPVLNPKGQSGVSSLTIIAIIVPILLSVLLFFIGYWFISKRKRLNHDSALEDDVDVSSVLQLDLGTIRAATNNFSEENKLGGGGFSDVYKGLLSDGQVIAVKRLSSNSAQGTQQFKNEVVLVAKLQHRNLVKLLGFCVDGEEKLLIYEFVPNKSLDHFLFDPKQRQLDWSTRYNIIAGTARGILYLHDDSQCRIIHRDLKASNILLDHNFNPKISDFGVARSFGFEQSQGNTSKIVGTYGYMAPEYAMHGRFSVKSDVYSFGVLILEIISGKRACFNESEYAADLLSYAWKLWRDGRSLELLDKSLGNFYSRNEAIRCIHIGLLCVQEDPDKRPPMRSIILMLEICSMTLATPQPPASFLRSTGEPSYQNNGDTYILQTDQLY